MAKTPSAKSPETLEIRLLIGRGTISVPITLNQVAITRPSPAEKASQRSTGTM